MYLDELLTLLLYWSDYATRQGRNSLALRYSDAAYVIYRRLRRGAVV